MSIFGRSRDLLTWQPPTAGSQCHSISLTADDGTWVKLEDLRGHLNVIFVIIDSITCPDVPAWLAKWSAAAPQFEAAETLIFGINTARTDDLRQFREDQGVPFLLLYDPLAIECRAMRCSSRVLPKCKNTVVAIDKEGTVLHSARGHVGPEEFLAIIAPTTEPEPSVDVKASAPAAPQATVENIDSDQAEVLINTEGGGYVLIDVRTQSEYDADHSPHAVHIPIDELPTRYKELKQTQRIICVCQAGGRSAAAAEFLTSIGGTEIFNVNGGMSAWSGERVTGGQLQS
jgi:rhodanese-related sulfurtransferase/peroxiredoxin